MKINVFLAFISLALAGLAAFGFFMANEGDTFRILVTVGAGLTLFVTLGGMLALSVPHGGSANIRVVSGMFLSVFFIGHVVFSIINVRLPPYIIIMGTLLLVYMMICYVIMRALK